MNLERYDYFADDDFKNFEFYSVGPKGKIKKAVRFTKINADAPFFYNLAFGDISEKSDVIDDDIVSNNNDRDIILATVAKTIVDFTNMHGNHYIFATGSTSSRTRLYQIAISKIWNEISVDFELLGFKDETWYPFEKNINYEAFLVKKK